MACSVFLLFLWCFAGAASAAEFAAWRPEPGFQPPPIVIYYDPATKTGVNWEDYPRLAVDAATPLAMTCRAAAYLQEALLRLTGQEFRVLSQPDLSRGIVLMLLHQAPADVAKDPAVAQALSPDPADQYAAKEAFFIRSEPQRLLVVANTVDGLVDGVVELLESVDYEVLGMGPNWIYAPDYKEQPLIFNLQRAGRPSYYSRNLWATSNQHFGVGTIGGGLQDPADEPVMTSYWRWRIGRRLCTASMPGFPGHALQGYHPRVLAVMRTRKLTEGFLAPQTRLGLNMSRPEATPENTDWLWINTDLSGSEAGQVFISNGKSWVPNEKDQVEIRCNLDLSVPFVREILLDGMKQAAAKAFETDPDGLVICGMEAEDGCPANAILAERMAHKNWYPEYLAKEGVPFGQPYVLHGFNGLDQPRELWDPAAASDNMFGCANYLLREFDKWVDSLPQAQQVTATGKSKKELVRLSFYSYNYHDVPPNFNVDPRVRVMIAGFPKHRGQGKWAKFATQADMARAFKVMLPREPSGDYRMLSTALYRDPGPAGIVPDWSPAPAALVKDYRGAYDAGYRAMCMEMDFNFGKYGLGYYLVSKLLWNVNVTAAELVASRDRWLQRAYGSAWQEMKAYYDFMLPENYPLNGTRTWAKAIRLLDAADRKLNGGVGVTPRLRVRADTKVATPQPAEGPADTAEAALDAVVDAIADSADASPAPAKPKPPPAVPLSGHDAAAQRRLDDLKVFWYYHFLTDSGKFPARSPELKEFLWKGQMSYMVAMHVIAQRDFGVHWGFTSVLPKELVAGPAHYTHEETQSWWAEILAEWPEAQVTLFADAVLANGKPGRGVDLNDLVSVQEFQSDTVDVPYQWNSGSGGDRTMPFLTIARQKGDAVGFVMSWPYEAAGVYRQAARVHYGAEIWDTAAAKWEPWLDQATTSVPTAMVTGYDGKPNQRVEVRLTAPRAGTYRFSVGRGGDLAALGSLPAASDGKTASLEAAGALPLGPRQEVPPPPAPGNVNAAPAAEPAAAAQPSGVPPEPPRGSEISVAAPKATPFTYFTNASWLTQSPVYFYIPKGTKRLDLEVWDQFGGKYLHLYRAVPARKPDKPRVVDLSKMGTYSVALQPGEDGTVAMLSSNGFAFPVMFSIPTLWAKSPGALLVPRAIAEADGLTVLP